MGGQKESQGNFEIQSPWWYALLGKHLLDMGELINSVQIFRVHKYLGKNMGEEYVQGRLQPNL